MLKENDDPVGRKAPCRKAFHYMCGKEKYSQNNGNSRVIIWGRKLSTSFQLEVNRFLLYSISSSFSSSIFKRAQMDSLSFGVV